MEAVYLIERFQEFEKLGQRPFRGKRKSTLPINLKVLVFSSHITRVLDPDG